MPHPCHLAQAIYAKTAEQIGLNATLPMQKAAPIHASTMLEGIVLARIGAGGELRIDRISGKAFDSSKSYDKRKMPQVRQCREIVKH